MAFPKNHGNSYHNDLRTSFDYGWNDEAVANVPAKDNQLTGIPDSDFWDNYKSNQQGADARREFVDAKQQAAVAEESAIGSGYDYAARVLEGVATTEDVVERMFSYHRPTHGQELHLIAVREAAKTFALAILAHVPPGSDRTAAIRKIREAGMTANAAIVLKGLNL